MKVIHHMAFGIAVIKIAQSPAKQQGSPHLRKGLPLHDGIDKIERGVKPFCRLKKDLYIMYAEDPSEILFQPYFVPKTRMSNLTGILFIHMGFHKKIHPENGCCYQ